MRYDDIKFDYKDSGIELPCDFCNSDAVFIVYPHKNVGQSTCLCKRHLRLIKNIMGSFVNPYE
jgi:hypothetical protein